ncbi:MAG TPA: TlpA disulfide reductase family protein, partial [Vicinamibacterales bacterium]|nr:TlpA disulfide reductase family protein [Vicinamibacterales bacterium]
GAAAGAPSAAPALPDFCDAKPRPARLDFTVKDMHGRSVRLSDYKGKVVLLNFWATWCGPCKVEIPALVDVYTRYRDKGLAVVGISVDDSPEQLRRFAQDYKMNYPVLVGRDREDIVDEAYGPNWAIPVSFLISRDGRICRKHMGPLTKDQLERQVTALLGVS